MSRLLNSEKTGTGYFATSCTILRMTIPASVKPKTPVMWLSEPLICALQAFQSLWGWAELIASDFGSKAEVFSAKEDSREEEDSWEEESSEEEDS